MTRAKLARRVALPIRDFLAGLALFGLIAASGLIDPAPAGTGWISSAAHARPPEREPAAPLLS